MADGATGPMESLSSWWRVAAIVTMATGFAVLILLTVKAYQNAPPIPDKFVDPAVPWSSPLMTSLPGSRSS
jgi:nitric oxide reductase subunit B